MANAISWFELPATDLDRATNFYQKVMGYELQRMEMGGTTMAFFSSTDDGVGGCVTFGDGNKPNSEGALVYLNGGDDLSVHLSRVDEAGGSVVMPKTQIGENGFMGVFMDTEGNRVAFHSMG